MNFPVASLGANFLNFEKRGSTNMCNLRAAGDDVVREIDPSPSGCGANWSILRCHPRLWTRHSLRIPPRLNQFPSATPPPRKFITGSRPAAGNLDPIQGRGCLGRQQFLQYKTALHWLAADRAYVDCSIDDVRTSQTEPGEGVGRLPADILPAGSVRLLQQRVACSRCAA